MKKKLMVYGLWLMVVGCGVKGPASSCEVSACGGVEDCPALCRNVARLGCYESWGIDADDGTCLELCLSTPGLCPKLGAVQESCRGIDEVSVCEK